MSGSSARPEAVLRDLDAGVWALACSASGRTAVTGSEDGKVAAWDLRALRPVWQVWTDADATC